MVQLTEEEQAELARVLDIPADDYLIVFQVNRDGEPDGTALHVLLIDGDNMILVQHGWGASGAHVDVRCFVGVAAPAQITPEVLELNRTVMVGNPYKSPQ